MMTIGDKQYRNLQEQVQKNKDDIATLVNSGNIAELGIKVINAEAPLTSASQLPPAATYEGNYGDGYIVGAESPYRLYVYSRTTEEGVKGFWFDFGILNAPSIVPGPIGPQGIQGTPGVRGSFWYSQSGAPTNTVGVNPNDQALDGSSGNVYQFVNGAWQLTGNIRGPQGIQGIQGIMGEPGPQGQVGPQGPQGPQGEFIQIVGELNDTNQLPMIDTVPRSTAYLIPDSSGSQHVWLIIGDGSTANPYLWHDAGAFGGGSQVLIDGTQQASVDMKNVINGAATYQIGENTEVTINGSEVTFSNLQVTGTNLGGVPVDTTANIGLPIASSSEIELSAKDNTLQMNLTPQVWNEIDAAIAEASPTEVQITAPTTSTNGQLSGTQLATLQGNPGAYLMFNDEIYRLQDSQHESGYLVYSHIGYNNTTQTYMIKCITVTISTRGWVLSEREVVDGANYSRQLYRHVILLGGQIENNLTSGYIEYISSRASSYTLTSFIQELYLQGSLTIPFTLRTASTRETMPIAIYLNTSQTQLFITYYSINVDTGDFYIATANFTANLFMDTPILI